MGMKSLWSEFKAFAFKGNMIDLAVAVVIGAAFSGVINSLVKDIIMPTVIYATSAVKEAGHAAADVAAKTGIGTTQPTTVPADGAAPAGPAAPAPAAPPPPPPADPSKAVQLDWKIGNIDIGSFISALLNFIIVAFAVFVLIVKVAGGVMKKMGGTPAPSEPTTRECPECLSVIAIKAKRCPNCTSVVTPL
jgi:large conductance mechanosensitive channel